ncbi:MAG: hypothetical protein M1820_002150 [Bogoriella megaspora]|nr:MAG: hypothetical protein M1820_002150 [Bogoriella megaspora]
MSRRAYPVADRYEEVERDYYRDGPSRPRSNAPYDDLEVDIDRRRGPARTEYAPTEVRERRGNVPEFLREDYGARSTAGPLVVRDDFVERGSRRGEPERVERSEIKITERDRATDVRSRRGDDVRSEIRSVAPSRRDVREEEIIETKSTRAPTEWMPKRERERGTEIDINIREQNDTRSRRGSPPRTIRDGDREEIVFRRGEVERRPRREIDTEEVVFRHEERPSPPRSRARSVGARETDIDIKLRDVSERGSRAPSRFEKEKIEKEEIVFRPRERVSPPPQLIGREREEIVFRRPRPPPPEPPREVEREHIVIRQRRRSSPSPVPPPAPPPPPAPVEEKEQIIIRQRRQRTPSPSPSPSPPPPRPAFTPEPIVQPPIKQEIIREIITHHRHIDHGVERARSPSPPPAPEPPRKEEKREEDLEIEIRRRGTRDGKPYDEDIIFEQRQRENASRAGSVTTHRPRSASPARTERSERHTYRDDRDDIAAEADYYNRKVSERAYMGEAWNGATKDWAIVDVPPGTRRVQMDGIGGGSQEISWQQYNGVRRGKFITASGEYEADFESGRKSLPPPSLPPPEPERSTTEVRETRIDIRESQGARTGSELVKRDEVYKPTPPRNMWTEVTKDLVSKEAIEELGYDYEETEPFYYIMEYLQYVSNHLLVARYENESSPPLMQEDVLRLVELSERIRHQRRDRIKDIQWEREELTARDRYDHEHRPKYDEVIYEREVYEEAAPRRHRYRY